MARNLNYFSKHGGAMSYREIGDRLGITEKAVEQIIRRALKKIRAELIRRGVVGEQGGNHEVAGNVSSDYVLRVPVELRSTQTD